MDKQKYEIVENHMRWRMDNNDTAHGYQHIYRVLYNALEISKEYDVDDEVIIVSSLLHDIGRDLECRNAYVDHAKIGAEIAYSFLISNGWSTDKANHIKECISTHSDRTASSIEAKILYDADKLDIIGAVGLARLIAHSGIELQPLYSVSDNGMVLPGEANEEESFFRLYQQGFKNIYEKLYTDKAKEIANNKKQTGLDYFNKLYEEVYNINKNGIDRLDTLME